MKKYPKRKNKLYKEIDIFNIHKCIPECEYDIYQMDDIVYFNINELVNGKCEQNNLLSRGLIRLNDFNINQPKTIMNDLLYNDEVVLDNDINIYINFPIKNKSTFKIFNEKNITISQLIDIIRKVYQQIYDDEYKTCSPIKYTFIENCNDCNVNDIQDCINNKDKINNQECSICLENNEKTSIKLDCGHILHNNCLNKWISTNNNTCPICRDYINKCDSCKGKLQIEKEYENKVIPIEHRTNFISRNTTDGIFGIYGVDFENLHINRIFYCKNNNKIYLKF